MSRWLKEPLLHFLLLGLAIFRAYRVRGPDEPPPAVVLQRRRELGQLIFIATVLALIALARRLPIALPHWTWRVPPYAIGTIASFWLIERQVALAA